MIIKPKYYGPAIPSTYAVNMTAAASGSNGITVADDDDIDFGTGDFFLHWEGSLDVAPPASIDWVYIKYQDGSNYWGMRRNTNGTLTFIAVVAGTTIISCTSSASPIVAGAIGKLTFCCTRESASANGSGVFYYNAASFSTASISAIAVRTINNSAALYISGDNAKRIASNTISCIVGNFAPTAAEVLDLCTNGIPESWKWGSQAAAITIDFTDSLGGFSGVSGLTVTAVDGIFGRDNVLSMSSGGASSARARRSSFGAYLFRKTKVTFMAARAAGNVTATGVLVGLTVAGADTLEASEIFQISAFGAWESFESDLLSLATEESGRRIALYPVTASGSALVTSGDIIYIDDLSTYKLGATMALLPNSIPTSGATAWDDSSGNTGGGTLPAAGATKVTIRK